MKNIAKWMLGAAVVAGGLGMGTTKAQAAEVRVYGHGPVVREAVRPRPEHRWDRGYDVNSYQDAWAYGGVRAVGPAPMIGVDRRYEVRRDHDRRFDRDHFRR